MSSTAPAVDRKVVAYGIVQFLNSLTKDEQLNGESLTAASKLIQEAFGINPESTDDFRAYSTYPTTLEELVTAGCTATETQPYGAAMATAQANTKYEPFVETVSKKGYFNGVEEGSLEWLQRSAKVTLKFKEKINAAKPTPATAAANEAAAEAKKAEGNAAVAKKDYKTAVAKYTEALALSPAGPNSHIFLTNRAAAHCYLRNYDTAVADCKQAVVLDPLYVKAHSRLGLAHFFMNQYEEAAAAYERAVELEPDSKAHKDSLRQAKQKMDEKNGVAAAAGAGNAPSSSSSSGAGGMGGMPGAGAGGMPDMAALAQMMGGEGGAGGLGAMMQNPQIMAAAQQMMQNPAMMQQAMAMMQGMGGGGGGGAGGMPDMAAMAQMMQGMNAGAAANKGGKKK